MKRLAMVLVVLTALALPAAASANYNLSLDGANTLVISPAAGEPSVAVDYTAFCIPGGLCATGQTVNSANNATTFLDNTGGACTDNAVVNAGISFNCNNIDTTRVVGTGNADAVKAVCAGVQSALMFQAGGGDDTVTGGGCTGSVVDLGPGDDEGTVNGSVAGGPGADLLIPGPGIGPNTISGGPGIDTVSYENRAANRPVQISLDNTANDGQAGLDRIAGDVENERGGRGNDTIVGDGGSNLLEGGQGNDLIDGRGGLDFLDGGSGNDRLLARDGHQDRVACGEGNDVAVVDAFDSVDGCEKRDSSRQLMPDVDNDGVPAPADCADHNPKRRPGFRDIPGNKVDEDCSGSPAPFPQVQTSVQSLFTFGSVTRFTLLKLRGVPEHARVQLRCSGGSAKGCFSGVKKFRFPKGKDTANIRRPVRSTGFRPGSRFEVRVLAPESLAKVVRFTMRRGAGPRQSVLCLAPGKKKPSRCPR
jgi:Ca2+-binding RTX toxin-like protein